MALFCSIYIVNFSKLIMKHDLAVGADMTEMVDFVLAHLQYELQNDRNDSHTAYNVLGSNNITNTAKLLGYVLVPMTHVHLFIPAQQFSIGNKTLALEKSGCVTVLRNISATQGLRARNARM